MVNLAGGPGNFSVPLDFSTRNAASGFSSGGQSRQFSPSNLLAALFDGNQGGPLSRWVDGHPGQPFQEAWNRGLSEGQRQAYRQAFGLQAADELVALSQEQDPALFSESLLNLAGRLENSEQLQAASLLYQAIPLIHSQPELNRRATARLDAIRGRGDGWARAAFLGQRLLAQSSEPSTLVGMGVAGTVGRGVRLAMLSRLAGSRAGILTRGLAARSIASGTALALEAPAFTATTRGVNVLLDRPQDWSGRGLWREFAAGATTLFGLKVSGALGGSLARRYAQGETLLARGGRVAISQSALLGGIYASHWAEQELGFREHVDGETTAVDTLSTWIQFNLAGALSRRIMGERFHRAESEMDQRTEILARQNAGSGLAALPSLATLRSRFAVPLAASLATCLTGCSVAGEHSGSHSAAWALLAGVGFLAAVRSRGGRGTGGPRIESPETAATGSSGPDADSSTNSPQNRAVQIQVGRSSLEMEARADQAISDRLLVSYENALRNLLEGTEDGFAMLQGEVADQLRSDAALRQRILEASAPSITQRRVRAIIGPAGRLLGFQFIEAIGLLDAPPPPPAAVSSDTPVEAQIAVQPPRASESPAANENPAGPIQRNITGRLNQFGARADRAGEPPWNELANRGRSILARIISQPKNLGLFNRALSRTRALTPASAVDGLFRAFEEALENRESSTFLDAAVRSFTETENQRRRDNGQLPRGTLRVVALALRDQPAAPAESPAPAEAANFREASLIQGTVESPQAEPAAEPRIEAPVSRSEAYPELRDLLQSLRPELENLEGLNPEQRWQRLFKIWRNLPTRPASLGTFATAVETVVIGRNLGDLRSLSFHLERILQNWAEWAPHFERLIELPSAERRGYARDHFRRQDGSEYRDTYLQKQIRLGTWLWNNRIRLGLTPEPTIEAPPPQNLEPPAIDVSTATTENPNSESVPRPNMEAAEQASLRARSALRPLPAIEAEERYKFRHDIIRFLDALPMEREDWSEVRSQSIYILSLLDNGTSAARTRSSSNLYYLLVNQRSGATPAQVLEILNRLASAVETGRDQTDVYRSRRDLSDRLSRTREYFRYRDRILSEISLMSELGGPWADSSSLARQIFERIWSRIANPDSNPFFSSYLQRILITRRNGASASTLTSMLGLLDREIEGTPQERISTALLRLERRLENQAAVERAGSVTSPVLPLAPRPEPESGRADWFAVQSRIQDFRQDDNLSGRRPQDVANARRVLDTLERLRSLFPAASVDLLLDRYEEQLASSNPDFDAIHEQRRAMAEQGPLLSRLRNLSESSASPEIVAEAHRTFDRFFHPSPLNGNRLSEAIQAMTSILDSGLEATRQLDALRQLQAAVTENRPLAPTAPEPAARTEVPAEGNRLTNPAEPNADRTAPVSETSTRIPSLEELEAGLEGLSPRQSVSRLLEYINSLFHEESINARSVTAVLSRSETMARLQGVREIARRHRILSHATPYDSQASAEPGLSRRERRAMDARLRKNPPTLADILDQLPRICVFRPLVELISPRPETNPEIQPEAPAEPTNRTEREAVLPPPPSMETILETEGGAQARTPSPAGTRLGDLLGRPEDPEIVRIERFIEGENSHQRDAFPPTLDRLREIRGQLGSLSELDSAAREARDALVANIDELSRGPSNESIAEFTLDALTLNPSALTVYEALSPLAREGLYVLTLALRGENRRQLSTFLERCSSPAEANQILETVALLHDRGVRGYENSFLPVGRDEKFLSSDSSRSNSLQAEHNHALRLAGRSHVRRLWLGQRMSINWSRLSEAERQMLDREVLPALGRLYRYDQQRSVEVDAGYQTAAGGRRIVEVKTTRSGTLNPQGEQAASIILQAFRHALLVRQHGLEGVEYILEGPSVSPSFVNSLQNVLNRLAVPYLIRVHETGIGSWRTLSSGMDAGEGSIQASQNRIRPLPLPQRQRISSSPPPPPEEPSAEAWSEAMIDLLNLGLNTRDRLSRRATREEAVFQLSQLPGTPLLAAMEEMRSVISGRMESLSGASRLRLSELLGALRFTRNNRAGRQRILMLLEIAALVTGTEAAASVSRPPTLSEQWGSYLDRYSDGFENWLRDYELSLEALDNMSGDYAAEELRPYLEEYSPDANFEASNGFPEGTLRSLLSQLQRPELRRHGQTYGERLEGLIERYETLRSSMVLAERPSTNP